ncbi:MAG TPA: hypothetical protein VMT35_01045 [Ignavibacteriaceae bacterium]|nr:hypothetical protein [Ignavibacteriaceae bacterium]
MENQKVKNKIRRRQFFTKSAAGFLGFTLISGLSGSFFNLLKKEKRKVIVEINPNAVSRKSR